MKKVKRIIALIGAIALVALYISTLVLAIIGSEQAMNLLRASIYSTVVLPALLWAYTMIYKLLKDHYSADAKDNKETISNAQDNNNDVKNSGD
ncbi:MAG: hypothetical protein LUD14_07575 [Clostridiales bacterium]|nr:hypothetical protein [Clostridiales bacterium]